MTIRMIKHRENVFKSVGIVVMLAFVVLAAALPATATPIAGLHYLVGSWNCTYRAGTVRFDYHATYSFDLDGHTLRQVTSSTSYGDEELLSYDAQRSGWTAVALDDKGNATVMRATGSVPNHIAYRSVYPDASISETFDRVSSTEYTLHANVRSGGKMTTSVDTCLRSTH